MATKTRAGARELGQHALQGWRKRVADAAAPRIAGRTRVSEADIRAAIGLAFLVLAIRHLTVTLKRFAQQRQSAS
jgi:hypothetical protein